LVALDSNDHHSMTSLFAASLMLFLSVPQEEAPIEARELALANQYRAVAELYGGGEFDRGVTTLSTWRRTDIETALGRVHSGFLLGGRWTSRLTRIAVMLHTELAMRRFQDERGSAEGQWHLGTAERLLRFPELASDDSFRRDWYLASATVYHSAIDSFAARDLLQRARTLLPRDAAVLFASGTTEETIARIHPARRVPVTVQLLQQAESVRRRELAQARDYFRRALGGAPDHELARLHLGRVLALLGSRDAADVLAALERSSDGSIRHLSCLFLGAIHEERRAWPEAVRWYEAAVRHYPQSRAAAIALSEALQRAGRTAESRQVLVTRVLVREASPDREPWEEYPIAYPAALDDVWLPLRSQALK
jgi:tetratricopeptide (TPR) repeat protein